MKKVETEMEDELRPEYDLKSLRVRRLGPGRKSFGGSVIRLEPDVEALRFLIRITEENKPSVGDAPGNA